MPIGQGFYQNNPYFKMMQQNQSGPPAGQTPGSFAPGGYYNPTGQYGGQSGAGASQPMYPPQNPNPTPTWAGEYPPFHGGPYVPHPAPDFSNIPPAWLNPTWPGQNGGASGGGGGFGSGGFMPQQPVSPGSLNPYNSIGGGGGSVFGGNRTGGQGFAPQPAYQPRPNLPMPLSQILERLMQARQMGQPAAGADPIQAARQQWLQNRMAGGGARSGPQY